MFQSLKRIKKLWALTRKDQKAIETLENLTPEQLQAMPEEGDGKAEFFGPATDKDLLDFQREEEGSRPWYELLKRLK